MTTGQYFGEGSDLSTVNTLFLVYPFSFKGKLIQYIGRVQRSEISPTIYDYRDTKIDYLNKSFLKRNTYYRKIIRQATLFDEPPELPLKTENENILIEKTINVKIADLEFRYGNIGFEYMDQKTKLRLIFEIENEEIRPEFEVLKPYFAKVLKRSSIAIELFAEIENGVILSQMAISSEIDKINKEVVESVKFQFLYQGFMHQTPSSNQNLHTSEDFPKTQNIYPDSEELLTRLLSQKSYKHVRHVRFLARRHKRKLLRLRFVLEPFSFVFLLEGLTHYHLVLETLDTEEATYIWHLDKDISTLPQKIQQIDQKLSFIRKKGRQTYLNFKPKDFSRILHHYSSGNKGFIDWKAHLEERLI